MKAILLDGSLASDRTGGRLCSALTASLQSQGWDVQHIALREKEIRNCAGDFFCWVRTPGVCSIDDDNRAIAEAIVASDLLVYLTPVTFGGYSPTLKRMVEHQIQNVSPFFTRIGGETHHEKRYGESPDLLVVGWMDAPDPQLEAVFRHLVQRNAINFHAKTYVSAVILADRSDEELQASARQWLTDLQGGRSSDRVELPRIGEPVDESIAIRRALLLVGSPKGRTSASNSLGEYLLERLGARAIRTETMHVHNALRSPEAMRALLDAVDTADLVTLAFPLYVDAPPAAVIELLERIAAHRHGREARRQSFAAIANCGFPEACQNATALAICETFARRAKFAWAGSLGLGGGGIVEGVPLVQGGRKTIRIRKALELAADALAKGHPIPSSPQQLLAKPFLPHWAYRLIGDLGWRRQARHFGAARSLKLQPYATRRSQGRTRRIRPQAMERSS